MIYMYTYVIKFINYSRVARLSMLYEYSKVIRIKYFYVDMYNFMFLRYIHIPFTLKILFKNNFAEE